MANWPEIPGSGVPAALGRNGQQAADDWPQGSSFPINISAGGSPRGRADRRRPRPRLAIAGLAVALAGLAASLAGVIVQALPRTFTAAQQQQITAWEIGGRWRSWPAGRIFPAAVRYELPAAALAAPTGLALTAHRAGIARQANCRAAADPAVGRALARHGCLAMLRATYADATGSMAVTVGIAVFPDTATERAAARALPGRALPTGKKFAPGVRPVRFRGTAAARFGPAQRQLTWASSRGPYLIVADAGYSDGRPRVYHESADPYALTEMRSLALGVGGEIGSRLAAAPPPPHCPGTPGC